AVALLAGLGGGVTAYLVAGFFNTLTSHLSPTILFWAFLGMMELTSGGEPRRRPPMTGQWAVAVPLAGAIAGLFAAWMAWTLAMADREFKAGTSTRDLKTRVRHLERAAEGHPAPWRARYELAVTYWAMGRHTEAIAAEREVLRLRPLYVEALDKLA